MGNKIMGNKIMGNKKMSAQTVMGNGYTRLLCTITSAKNKLQLGLSSLAVISVKEQHQMTVLKTFFLVVLNRC